MRAPAPALPFALLAGLAAFALAAFAPGLLNDSDTYWHISAGQWMLAHHQLLRTDVFSYTAAGAPWHTQEWLAEILMALAWKADGTRLYQRLPEMMRESWRPCAPLRDLPVDRPAQQASYRPWKK